MSIEDQLWHSVMPALGNGTGRRTAKMAARLLLTNGPTRYEANPLWEGREVQTWDSAHSWQLL